MSDLDLLCSHAPAILCESAPTHLDDASINPTRTTRNEDKKYESSASSPREGLQRIAQMGLLPEAARIAQSIASNRDRQSCTLELLDHLKSLGAADLSIARLFEGHFNALYLVALYGTAEQFMVAHNDAKIGKLFAVWNAEGDRPVSVDISSGGFVLSGEKQFCSGAGYVERALITAAAENGSRVMVLVPLPQNFRHDVSTWKPTGMRASVSGTVDFSNVNIAQADIVGDRGDYLREPTFSGGAWRFLAAQLGAINALVDGLRKNLVTFGRHGDALQKARFGQALIAVETADLWVRSAALQAQNDRAHPEQATSYVALARHAVEHAAFDVIEIVQRSIGLAALLDSNPAERIMRDLSTYLRQPAPDRVLLNAAAYALNTDVAIADLWKTTP